MGPHPEGECLPSGFGPAYVLMAVSVASTEALSQEQHCHYRECAGAG